MNTKKLLAMIVAVAMIISIVPMFGIVASADEAPAFTIDSIVADGGESWDRVWTFDSVSGDLRIEFDVTYTGEVNDDFIGFGNAVKNGRNSGIPVYAGTAVGIYTADTDGDKAWDSLAFMDGKQDTSAGDKKPAVKVELNQKYHFSISTNTTEKNYTASVTKDGEVVTENITGGYRDKNENTEIINSISTVSNNPGNFKIENIQFFYDADSAVKKATVTVNDSNGEEMAKYGTAHNDRIYVGDKFTPIFPEYRVNEQVLQKITPIGEINVDDVNKVVTAEVKDFRQIVGENKVNNPSFEDDLANWTVTGGGELPATEYEITTDAANVTDGGKALFAKGNGGNEGTALDTTWDVTAGKDYFISVDAKATKTKDHQNAWFYANDSTTKIFEDLALPVSGQWYTKQGIVTLNETQNKIGFYGSWFGNDSAPYFDNFKVYELDILADQQERENIPVDLVNAEGTVVGSGTSVTSGIVGETATVLTASNAIIDGIDGNKYFVPANVQKEIPKDGSIKAEVTLLSTYMVRDKAQDSGLANDGVWVGNGNASDGNDPTKYNGQDVFGGYAWSNNRGYDRLGVAVLALPEGFNASGNYALTADNYRLHANGGNVTTLWAISKSDYSEMTNITAAGLYATKNESNVIFEDSVIGNIIPLNAEALASVVAEGDSEVVILATSSDALIGLTGNVRIIELTQPTITGPTLGWNGSSFTINYITGSAISKIDINNNGNKTDSVVAAINNRNDSNFFQTATENNGIAFVPKGTNIQYQAKAVAGKLESEYTAPTSIYKLVADAIAEVKPDTLQDAQKAAAIAVLNAGGVGIKDGALNTEAAKLLKLENNIVTVSDDAAAAGLVINDGEVSVSVDGVITKVTATEGKIDLSSVMTAAAEEVALFEIEFDFADETVNEIVDAVGEVDFVEEI